MSKPSYEDLIKKNEELERVHKELLDKFSEQERLAAELGLSEERLKILLNYAPDAIYMINMDGIFLDGNKAAEELTGFSLDELMGKNFLKLKLLPSRQLPKARKSLAKNALGKSVGPENYTIIRKDGKHVQVEIRSFPITIDNQKVSLGIARDITERQKSHDELVRNLSLLESTMESTADGLLVVDVEGKVTFFNNRFIQLWHIPENLVDQRDDKALLEFVLNQLIEPQEFMEKVQYLYDHPNEISEDTLKFKDGRTFERYSRPQKIGGKIVGRVWSFTDITLQKNSEYLILHSKKILSDVLDTIPVRVFWKEINSIYLGCNKLFAKDAGRSKPGDLIGDSDFEMGWAEQAEMYRRDDKQVMSSGKAKLNYEEPQTTPNGEKIWLRTSKTPLRDTDGEIYGVLGTYEDITEQKKNEKIQKVLNNILNAAIKTENLVKLLEIIHREVNTLMDAKNFYVALYDKISDTYMFPYFADEFDKMEPLKQIKLGKGFTEYVRKSKKPLLIDKAKAQKLIDKGKVELVGRGAESWLGVPLMKENLPFGVVAVQSYSDTHAYNAEDLNVLTYVSGQIAMAVERKYADDALRVNEEKYRILVESSPYCIHQIDVNGKILSMNQAGLRMLGKENEKSIIGWPYLNTVCTEDRERISKLMDAAYEGKYAEFEFKGTDESEFRSNFAPIHETDGRIDRLLGITQDITENKRLEEQLQIRQRMDSLGTLASGITHDFNNILFGIMGNIGLLNLGNENFTEIQKKRLNNTAQSCERAKELIQQFQTMSKGSVLPSRKIDIFDISKEVFGLLKETTNRLINKQIDFGKGEFFVKAVPSEIHQILLNLGINSLEAIEERGIRTGDYIRINAQDYHVKAGDKTRLQEGHYIYLTFEDNGIGMSKEILRQAFDPLFTTKDKFSKKGQGLGLAMAYNIVTLKCKGEIKIKSVEGEGTTFHIYLPSAKDEVAAEEIKPVNALGGTETILVVDDEEFVREIVQEFLIHMGYTVITANDGIKALEIYKEKENTISAVILDLNMPQMSGEVVFEKMLDINPEVKVIISSGHSDEYSKKGILAQAHGNVGKPYEIDDLLGVLRVILDS